MEILNSILSTAVIIFGITAVYYVIKSYKRK